MSLQHAKQRLLTIRAELEARLVRTHKHLHREEPVSANSHEQLTETGNDAVVGLLDKAGQAELKQVRKALRRIESGDYSHCSRCGKAIGVERLAALPWTEFCVDCA